MNISLFQDQDSWLHRLDPRTKMIGTVILFAMALSFNHPLFVAGVFAGALALSLWARAFTTLWKLKYLLLLLIVSSVILWPFFS